MSWIEFNEVPASTKTKRWAVMTIDGITELGIVRFYPQWRKYIFHPNENMVFEEDCLRDIAAFIVKQTEAWRESKKKPSRAAQTAPEAPIAVSERQTYESDPPLGTADIEDYAAFRRARSNPAYTRFTRRRDGSGYWTETSQQITLDQIMNHPHWIVGDDGVIDLREGANDSATGLD